MAAVDLIGGCAHAFGEEALQIGMHGLVFLADDVPARLRLPRRSFKLLLKRSASGTPWVAQTSFCSCSGKSPAKMPSLRLAQVIVKKLPRSPVRFGCRRGIVVRAGVAGEGVIASRITIDLHIRLV